ncbi:MAG: filamentous hemagglutinin N-terminal domain-containing protein [Cyanobacteria bacterium P01_G01_bin.54]
MPSTFILSLATTVLSLAWIIPAQAQDPITPDQTLGPEQSIITPLDAQNDRIDGGATRGTNLVHSFSEFNIGQGRGVYFANPEPIQNIFARVTGGNRSEILGTLGVLGEANLWLLNPNGIYFGPNARLDMHGSLIASTGDTAWLDDQILNATNPEQAPLLTIDPNALFQNQLANHQAQIRSEGQLFTPGDLTLHATSLELASSIQAEGNLNLLGNTVHIQDTTSAPTRLTAGGDLTIQGNEVVDIFVLNHPGSHVTAGGDITLISENPVVGDAHYWAGRKFSIETPMGELGDLDSPNDPIIFAREDVFLGSYSGASLHIWAGGLVFIPGDISIRRPDTVNSIRESVTLSDGETAIAIDGALEATLDIRAGIDWVQLIDNLPEGLVFGDVNPIVGDLDPTTASADIILQGSINVSNDLTEAGGKIFLTNQYVPNLALDTVFGGIVVNTLQTADRLGGGDIIIDSRTTTNLNARVNASSQQLRDGFLGDGGDVTIYSQGDINLNPGALITASGLLSGNIHLESQEDVNLSNQGIINSTHSAELGLKGGDITVIAQNINLADAAILTTSESLAQAGNIYLVAGDTISLNSILASVGSNTSAAGDAGDIHLVARNLFLNSGHLSSLTSGAGDAGDIDVQVTDSVFLAGLGAGISASTSDVGKAGNIKIRTRFYEQIEAASVSAASHSGAAGNGGSIEIQATESVLLRGAGTVEKMLTDGTSLISTSTSGPGDAGSITIESPQIWIDALAFILASVGEGAVGDGGTIALDSPGQVRVSNGSIVTTQTAGPGKGGDINIRANAVQVDTDGVLQLNTTANGVGGNLGIQSDTLSLTKGGGIFSMALGAGDGGQIQIEALERITIQGLGQQTESAIDSGNGIDASGNSGNIFLSTQHLDMTQGGRINASTSGPGQGGNINIDAAHVELDGESSSGDSTIIQAGVNIGATGDSGNVSITTETFRLTNGALLLTATSAQGDGGDVNIFAGGAIEVIGIGLNGFPSAIASQVNPEAVGQGGDIQLQGRTIAVRNGAAVIAALVGSGQAGDITFEAAESITVADRAFVNASRTPDANGDAGRITVRAPQVSIRNDARIESETADDGRSGGIAITSGVVELSNQAEVSSGSWGTFAGNIRISADSLTLRDRSIITTLSLRGAGGNITLDIAENLLLRGGSVIATEAGRLGGVGKGGNIDINALFIVAVPGENSDITADSVGPGGNITLSTNGLFGISPVDSRSPQEDAASGISASSEIGLDGEKTFNRLSFPAEQGLNELPESLVDVENILKRNVCAVQDGNIANDSSFTHEGSGSQYSANDAMSPNTNFLPWASRPDTTAPLAIMPPQASELTPSDRLDPGGQPSANDNLGLNAETNGASSIPTEGQLITCSGH